MAEQRDADLPDSVRRSAKTKEWTREIDGRERKAAEGGERRRERELASADNLNRQLLHAFSHATRLPK